MHGSARAPLDGGRMQPHSGNDVQPHSGKGLQPHSGKTRLPDGSRPDGTGLARFLGAFSLVLGGLEMAAPGAVGRWLGFPGGRSLVRAYGARETAAGIGLLATDATKPWLMARLGGDALDIGTLAMGLQVDNPRRQQVIIALVAVLGVTLLDVVAFRRA